MSGLVALPNAPREPRAGRRNILTGGPNLDPASMASFVASNASLPSKSSGILSDWSGEGVDERLRREAAGALEAPKLRMRRAAQPASHATVPDNADERAGGRVQPLGIKEILRLGRERRNPELETIRRRMRGEPTPAMPPNFWEGVRRFAISSLNQMNAAAQGTSPDTAKYRRLGAALDTDAGLAFRDRSGRLVPFNSREHVFLHDSKGVETIYKRSAKTDQGPVLSAARLFTSALQLDKFGAAGAAAKAAVALRGGRAGAGNVLASGIGPTGRAARVPLPPLDKLPAVSRARNPMTAAEFNVLANRGAVDPSRIRTLQKGVSPFFRPEPETGVARRVIDTVNDLRSGKLSPGDIEPVKILVHNGKVFTTDHRRLIAFRLAGLPIRYVKAAPREVRKAIRFKLDPLSDGLSIKIRKGGDH